MTTKASGAQIAEVPAYRRHERQTGSDDRSFLSAASTSSVQPVDDVVPPLGSAPSYENEDTLRCHLVPDRRAFYRYKPGSGAGDDIFLSSFAAAVLVRSGCITRSRLEPITKIEHKFAGALPTDPISGALLATTATVKDLTVGFASIPSEIAKTRRCLVSYPGPERNSNDFNSVAATGQLRSEAGHGSSNGQYAKAVAIGSCKTLVRITSAAVQASFTLTRDIGRGYGNLPRVYKDPTVRERPPITGMASGAKAAGQGFGYGLYDGVTGLFVQPYSQAKKGGALGFAKGFGMGLAGFVCKPTAGTYGLVGDVYDGVEQSWRRRRGGEVRACEEADVRADDQEIEMSSEAEREKVLEQWRRIAAAE